MLLLGFSLHASYRMLHTFLRQRNNNCRRRTMKSAITAGEPRLWERDAQRSQIVLEAANAAPKHTLDTDLHDHHGNLPVTQPVTWGRKSPGDSVASEQSEFDISSGLDFHPDTMNTRPTRLTFGDLKIWKQNACPGIDFEYWKQDVHPFNGNRITSRLEGTGLMTTTYVSSRYVSSEQRA